MLAHLQGQLFKASALGQSLGDASHHTATRYLDTLVDTLMVRRLEPLKDLQISTAWVIAPVPRRYPLAPGVEVIPLHELRGVMAGVVPLSVEPRRVTAPMG